MKNHTIDATNQSLGRVATQAASILQGKHSVDFARNTVSPDTVTVVNAGKIKVTDQKLLEKKYKSYSGYPGGLKQESMGHLAGRKGYKNVLELAIRGMLPANRLRQTLLKHLTITE